MNTPDTSGHEASRDSLDSQSGINQERIITGVSLSGGLAMGRPCFYRKPDAEIGAEAGSKSDQTARVHKALFEVARHYSNLAQQADSRLNQSAGDIFRAQSMLANDPSLIAALEAALSDRYASAEAAVTDTLDSFASELLSALSAYIRERACDITELKDDLLMHLGSMHGYVNCRDSSYCQFGDCRNAHDHILIATQFMPGTALSADCFTKGFVVETGGPSSHAAILARMMGLPAISGVSGLAATLTMNSYILVDGDNGRIYIDPSEETLAGYRERLTQTRQVAPGQVSAPPVKGIRILADLDRADDIPQVLAAQAEGIGLYRSESEVLFRQSMLSENEQFDHYRRLLDAVPGPVYIRLLDLGSDKSADWLDLPAEENPALGCRGARLLLQRPELLETQARALARAAQKRRIHILYPMVHSVNQYLKLRKIFETAISDIPDTKLSHGVMFEVPAACLEAQDFLEHADFGRIGTNDLTQYLFAVDRMNGNLEGDDLFEQPALWRLIENVARAGAITGKPVSICGELVSDPKYIARILVAGISEISTFPQYIAGLRQTARRLLESPEGSCCSASGQYSFLVV